MTLSMNKILRYLIPTLLAGTCALASSQPTQLTTSIPACSMPPGQVLPDKYYKLRGHKKEFAWVSKVTATDQVASGQGGERADGSSMYDWFFFYRIDLNGDGYCDWYVNDAVPLSSGGDRDSLNTLYLGGTRGWSRIGATMPGDKPDELGYGESGQQQNAYLFGEEPALIYDAAGKINYLITAFYDRSTQRDRKPGYRIYDWDVERKTLRLLDKWKPGSKAAGVYAFFKAHGAKVPSNPSVPVGEAIQRFDPDVEAFEIEQACDPQSALRSFPESNGVVSAYLLAHCKH